MQANNSQSLQPGLQGDKLADALQGKYQFSIKAIFDEAWERSNGFKVTYWGGLMLFACSAIAIVAVVVVLSVIVGTLLGGSFDPNIEQYKTFSEFLYGPMGPMIIVGVILFFLAMPFLLSLGAGLWMIGIHRAANNPSRAMMVWGYFHTKINLFKAWFFVWTLTFIANIIMRIPDRINYSTTELILGLLALLVGVVMYTYVSVSYALYKPLIVEKKLSSWQALESCRRAISSHWFKVAIFIALISLIIGIPVIIVVVLSEALHWMFLVLALVLIWLAPFGLLAMSILYREIFGIAPATE